ncbi:regulatory protein RecX [Caldinitratiruptor microaerophilus]|uniref:Regulatory protein RecX n=1 Tax=Caldinitratiruptor microaerophilus TaxID=671077 RepID=A0AA35G9P3_9FIRM|nr:RecX family transcriptional regulator [Caldinitratiruptor microaerophilus]BDG60499.1 hypothetical protein caldi_15890 [Caldinitratiruptor microaerophilus]
MAWRSEPEEPDAGSAGDRRGEGGEAERCLAAALRHLGRRALTAEELSRRLARRGFSEAAVSAALSHLAARGWLDDREYARQYVAAHRQGWALQGPRRLAAELRRRGVPPDIVAEVVGDLGSAELEAQAEALARSRLARMGGADRRTAWRRLSGLLARRGFEPEVVASVLRRVLAAPDPDASDEPL